MLKREKSSSSIVVASYCPDENYDYSPIKQTAQTARKLPASVIKLIRHSSTQKDPSVCLINEHLNHVTVPTYDEMLILRDCRSFSPRAHTLSLKSGTQFMRGNWAHGRDEQLYMKRRCKYYFQTNNFKPVQNTVVTIVTKACWARLNKVHFVQERCVCIREINEVFT